MGSQTWNGVTFVVIHGNPVDGFNFRGPFNNWQEAIDWADGEGHLEVEADWWIAAVAPIDADLATKSDGA